MLFAHGSGSSRHSPRNRYVAGELHTACLATVLADLLTAEEERIDAVSGQLRFDIGLLSVRLAALTDWLAGDERTAGLGVGLFGASTGAAAAFVTAAMRPNFVQAIVSRGGRPDLGGEFLRLVDAPTLLIVGERDPTVIELNRSAMPKLSAETQLAIIPAQRTCSRSRARWNRSPIWPRNGSCDTCGGFRAVTVTAQTPRPRTTTSRRQTSDRLRHAGRVVLRQSATG